MGGGFEQNPSRFFVKLTQHGVTLWATQSGNWTVFVDWRGRFTEAEADALIERASKEEAKCEKVPTSA